MPPLGRPSWPSARPWPRPSGWPQAIRVQQWLRRTDSVARAMPRSAAGAEWPHEKNSPDLCVAPLIPPGNPGGPTVIDAPERLAPAARPRRANRPAAASTIPPEEAPTAAAGAGRTARARKSPQTGSGRARPVLRYPKHRKIREGDRAGEPSWAWVRPSARQTGCTFAISVIDFVVTGYFTAFPNPQVADFFEKDEFNPETSCRKFLQIISWKASPRGRPTLNAVVFANYLEVGMDFAIRVNDNASTFKWEPIR